MYLYRHTGNIKAGLFILGIALVISLLAYTQSLIGELREDNREVVRLYAEIIAGTVRDENDTNLDFIFENIIQKVKFPIIQTDTTHQPQIGKNLPKSIDSKEKQIRFMKTMDRFNDPIPLTYSDKSISEITFGFLHYGDSSIIQKLQWWTYIEIISIAAFIFLGFAGFTFIRNNEKRHIWVGMARETAHQLGTPVSALMGWVEFLREHPDKTKEMVPEMEADLERLEQIGRRFSQLGSDLGMENIDISERVERIVQYLNRRLPSLGKKVSLINDVQPGIHLRCNGSLLTWAIENIIRNGIDAITRSDGEVIVSLRIENDRVSIRVKDNGVGIPRKDWRNIFRPGFSTKKAGWGLGLSLSGRIIQDIHQGQIKVVESSPSDGTTIEIRL